ncbi:MAG TPA: hypothetical protein VF006_15075 [Longimicrobium sp.]
MRRHHPVLLLLPLLLAACQAQTSPAPAPAAAASAAGESTEQDRAEVLAAIQGFMDALRMGDTTAMNQHVDSLTRLTLIRPTREGGTRVVVMTSSDFNRAITRQPGGVDEPIRNPVVHVSGDLASVWAEYQVRRPDSTVSHCGFDAFHLARRGGRWKFLNVSDTFQATGCGPAWPR